MNSILNHIKEHKVPYIIFGLTAFLTILTTVITIYFLLRSEEKQYDIFVKSNQPYLTIDSIYFPQLRFVFDKLIENTILEAKMIRRIKNGNKNILHNLSIEQITSDSTPLLRSKFLEGKFIINNSDFVNESMFKNYSLKPNDIFEDTTVVRINTIDSISKYYYHYLIIYQSGAGDLYDTYYIAEIEIINNYKNDIVMNPTRKYFGVPNFTNRNVTFTNIYNKEESKSLLNIIEKFNDTYKRK